MSYISDLAAIAGGNGYDSTSKSKKITGLDMQDFLTLMVAEFTNQSIDQTADTSDMLNQLIQMSVVQSINEITDATLQTYSASLVGKEVTIGVAKGDGKVEEIVGTVTGTAVYNDQQVCYIDGGDTMYYLNQIMAVGRLPEKVSTDNKTDTDDKTEGVEGAEGAENNGGTGDVDGSGAVDSGDNSEDTNVEEAAGSSAGSDSQPTNSEANAEPDATLTAAALLAARQMLND